MTKSPKKPKEKKQEESNYNGFLSKDPNYFTSTESNSNVFSFLFGEIPDGNDKISIFSYNNPFRRKPGNSSEEPIKEKEQNMEKVRVFENSDGSAELKKRKRKKEKNGDNGDGSGVAEMTPLEEEEEEEVGMKKLKRDESGIGDLDLEGEEKGGSKSNVDSISIEGKGKERDVREFVDEGNGIDEKKKNKKKRRRDEVEAEYEARRYGVEEEEVGKEEGGGVVGRKRKKMDSLDDIMVAKEGFDDESKLLRTVFVGNLPLKINKKVLIKEFNKFGEVESVRIRSIPLNDSKIPRKGAIIKKQINETADSFHAYVVFKTEESAQASLAHNMAVVGRNHIRIDRACPPRKKLKGDNAPLYDNKRTVFVGNLPFDVKDEEVYQLFSSIKGLDSSIEAIRIARDPGTSLGKGIAYVLFKTTDAANRVVRRHHLKLWDRDLRLYHATADTTPSKRKYPLPTETNTPPAKRFGGNSKFPVPENKMKLKAKISYQGLRASKSGVQKKTHVAGKLNINTQKMPAQKERQQKRPAVAARKAQQAGIKRKLEEQTPDSNGQKKKARKFT